jgi:hypothetical protein
MHIVVLYAIVKAVARSRHMPASALDVPTLAICSAATIVLCLLAIAILERTPVRRVVM